LPADWDDLLQFAAERIAAVAPQHLGLLTTTHATNEALNLLNELFCRHLKVRHVDLLNPVAPSPPSVPKKTLADLSHSDCILVTGTDPVYTHPVASMLIKRASDHGAQLIVIEDRESGLASHADWVLKTSETDQALRFARRAQRPAVVYGNSVSERVFSSLKKLAKAVYIALQPGVNTHAAVSLGLHQHIDFAALAGLYVLAGEQHEQLNEVAAKITPATFVVVQASYASPLTERADLVLPMAIWFERSGSLTNTDGIVQKVRAARTPQGQSKPDWEILRMLTEKLGGKSFVLPDDIAHYAGHESSGKENPAWQK
jgi:predicted molibdopterin-dependent oxidoreductase YjgC